MNKQLRRYDGSNGSIFQGARAEHNTPKYPRGYEYIFSLDERATTNYRRIFNHKKLSKKMEVTRNLLRQRFAEYNQAYFDGKLTMPKFYFLCSKRPFGRSICSKRGLEIWMTKRIIWTEDFFKEVLIHEMIHQYVYEVLKGGPYHIIQHGIRFHYVCWRLKRKYGLIIT